MTSVKDSKEAERIYNQLNLGFWFTDMVRIPGGTAYYNKAVSESYSNNACLTTDNLQRVNQFIQSVIKFYQSKQRIPAIYLMPHQQTKELIDQLRFVGFEQKYQDAWMFFEGETMPLPKIDQFKITVVQTARQKDDFVAVFKDAYSGQDPSDPYGALPEEDGIYLRKVLDSLKSDKHRQVVHYLATINNQPVGIVSGVSNKAYGIIYQLGTSNQARGQGVGTSLLMQAISDFKKQGKDKIFLTTEPGSKLERYYQKLGFVTKFIGLGYCLNEYVYGAKQAVNVCMGLTENQESVVITDSKCMETAKYLIEEIKKVNNKLKIFTIEDYGPRPFQVTKEILKALQKAEAIFSIADYVYGEIDSFYRPINEMVEKEKKKMVVMASIEPKLLKEGMNADYQQIQKFNKKLLKIVNQAKKIRVTTKKGTDFTVELGYKWASLDGFPSPGKWVNLPDGEVLTTPKNLNGVILIDGVAEWLGLLEKTPVKLTLAGNKANKDSIDCQDKKIKKAFIKYLFETDKNSCQVGEFAFGTNLFLKNLSGNLLQDEKFPSVHIAFGDPHGSLTGAKWKSNLHLDAIILKPTVCVDGKKIMEDGKYLI